VGKTEEKKDDEEKGKKLENRVWIWEDSRVFWRCYRLCHAVSERWNEPLEPRKVQYHHEPVATKAEREDKIKIGITRVDREKGREEEEESSV